MYVLNVFKFKCGTKHTQTNLVINFSQGARLTMVSTNMYLYVMGFGDKCQSRDQACNDIYKYISQRNGIW